MSISVQIVDEAWRPAKLSARLRRGAATALAEMGRKGAVTILMAGDDRLHELNAAFRQMDKSTNVLSFPASAPEVADGYLGDIALAYGVCAREAAEAGKTLSDHAVHLAVHGTLHLIGFDHIDPAEAEVMEAAEISILAKLGIANPYVLKS
ncbi:MAG: rRNA maturation RNase YbeY [Rhizomicrobium sp.]